MYQVNPFILKNIFNPTGFRKHQSSSLESHKTLIQATKWVQISYIYWLWAIVTSTSTPGSIEMEVICFTTSEGL